MKSMKKYVYNIFMLVAIGIMLPSCEKELMDYEGVDGLYFDVRYFPSHISESLWPHQYYTEAAFGSIMDDDIDIECKVMASGYPKSFDREFIVIANPDSTTAINGRDYEGLQDKYVIKAGETSTVVRLTAHRSAEMEGDTLRLQLKLQENEYFKLVYDNFEDRQGSYSPYENVAFSQNHNAAYHNIWLYDVMVQPGGWWAGLFGPFSAKKWRLMMEKTNTVIDDYASNQTMPSPRAGAINESFAEYLLERAKNRETVEIDEDGTMMWVSAVNTLGGSDGWSRTTRPEDYYK